MKKFKIICLTLPVCFVLLLAVLYASFLFVFPKIVKSDKIISKIEKIIFEKTDIDIKIEKLEFNPYCNLSFEVSAAKITAANKGKKFLNIENLSLSFLPFKIIPKDIAIDNLYFDKSQMPQFKKKNKKSRDFDFNSINDVKIKNAGIILQNEPKNHLKLDFDNISIINTSDRKNVSFNAVLDFSKIQHKIFLESKSNLYIKNNSILAEDFKIKTDNKVLILNGKLFDKNKNYEFKIKGSDFCVNAIEETFLTYIKQKNPQKNFIENFYNFGGLADINLNISNSALNGNILVKNLSAKTVKFNVPLYFKTADFIFNKDKITLGTNGLLGGEKAYTDLKIVDLFTDKKIQGSVEALVTSGLVKKYIPDYGLKGKINVNINYFVHNKKITVEYLANLPKGINISYKNSSLGLEDKERRIYAKTYKDGNKLYLKNYDYSYIENNVLHNIVLGDGLYNRINNHLVLNYINCKTVGWAPVSIIGSVNNFVIDGEFSGNLKYSGIKNKLTGKIQLKDSDYNNFEIDNALVNIDENKIVANAKGFYDDEPYSCLIDIMNRNDMVIINDMKLYLKKYIIKRLQGKKHNKKKIKISSNIKEIDYIVKNGYIKLDELNYENIILNNVELIGNAKNNIVNFNMPAIQFAQGVLSAQGSYDLNKHSSDIYFSADEVNSNLAAGMVFGLKNQVEGLANAMSHFQSFNKLGKITAKTTFLIEDGALTKIGSTNFMIKKNEKIKRDLKFKITDITNIDIKKMEALRSNITGSFDVNNHKIENAQIFTKHKYLALFIDGDYDIKKQDANISVWGAYNKDSQKGIRILFIPLSWITRVVFWKNEPVAPYLDKIEKIPDISADKKQKELFRVKMNGNINDNSSIKVQFKKLK